MSFLIIRVSFVRFGGVLRLTIPSGAAPRERCFFPWCVRTLCYVLSAYAHPDEFPDPSFSVPRPQRRSTTLYITVAKCDMTIRSCCESLVSFSPRTDMVRHVAHD